MKKIILTLFLSFALICLLCYLIYISTEKENTKVVLLGDATISNLPIKNKINLTNKSLHLNDLKTALEYNKPINDISIHESLNEADILIISIGMNDLYYIIDNNTKEIYSYLNNIISTYESILNIVNHYHFKKVYILGYYNINNKKQDLFTYLNYKLARLVTSYHYIFINTDKIIENNPKFLEKEGNFTLNKHGYEQIYNFIVENLENY